MKSRINQILSFVSSLMYLQEWFLIKIFRRNFTFKQILRVQPRKVKILGNGPSLKLVSNVVDSDYCCVNHSLMSELFFRIKPKYFVTVDPMFFSKYFLKEEEYIHRLLNIDWNLIWFVPYANYSFAKSLVKSNKNITVKWHPSGINLSMKISSIRDVLFKYGMAAPPAQNVLVAAIYDLLMDGYKQIELYGVEHSWLNLLSVDKENRVCLKDVHFYDNKEVQLKPWYRIDGGIFDMPTLLSTLAVTFGAYHDLQRFSTYIGGIEIVNMTPNSFIDAFKRGV